MRFLAQSGLVDNRRSLEDVFCALHSLPDLLQLQVLHTLATHGLTLSYLRGLAAKSEVQDNGCQMSV